ncbi:MAG: dynamin family protein [Leptolyngbyaceae cyanobacterium MO_188.B28]|nr:dynamin family protein [Leptolyngbyaceae cyanobacterium MO_188.B28]
MHQSLVNTLRQAVGLLTEDSDLRLKQSVITMCDRVTQGDYRIAVFGPFNYGKSTLLNALLGEKALPIDLIPTTGAAISVCYGPALQNRITLKSGQVITEEGVAVLKRYAILDDQRRMREDVAAVAVECPHPFLRSGVELLDLPGTDDREQQNDLVQDQLLTADLIIQMLDGRKLMTLGEREHLRDWLLDRGIKTVVFVVNFLNLMLPEDQKQVSHRLRFVAESFRTDLPMGVSNLYRVDALPALRARLKGDASAAQVAGLPMLESALQTIVQERRPQVQHFRQQRLAVLAQEVHRVLEPRAQALAASLENSQQRCDEQKAAVLQKAKTLIKQGFDISVRDLRNWLIAENLLSLYQAELAIALKQFDYGAWKTFTLEPAWTQHRKAVVNWVHKACDFFERPRPADLWIALPDEPTAEFPSQAQPETARSTSGTGVAPVAIATGLGWVLGGPLGATLLGGTSYFLNQSGREKGTTPSEVKISAEEVDRLYHEAAGNYLSRFSIEATAALDAYERTANDLFEACCESPRQPLQTLQAESSRLHLMRAILEDLSQVSID